MAEPLSVVVVGASLAGARCAGTLRREGYAGKISLIGDEDHLPYERPPLSKEILAGKYDPERAFVDIADLTDVEWKLQTSATGLDIENKLVKFRRGGVESEIAYDGLVIATGASPRTLPGSEGVGNVFVLRSLEDAAAIATAFKSQPTVVVIGGGFIGSEVASTAASLGLNVTIVDPIPTLMARPLGDAFSDFFMNLHSSNGVNLRLGESVEGLVADATNSVSGVRLGSGEVIDADLVVVGIGVIPNTGWLEGSGVGLDNGVTCDATCAVLDKSGTVVEGMVACGDVARWYNELFARHMRVEHWENAIAMGEAAALRLLSGPDRAVPFADVPIFWSDQHGKKIQFVGNHAEGDDISVIDGSLDEGKFVAAYGRQGVLVGALGVGRPARVIGFRDRIARRDQYPPVDSENR